MLYLKRIMRGITPAPESLRFLRVTLVTPRDLLRLRSEPNTQLLLRELASLGPVLGALHLLHQSLQLGLNTPSIIAPPSCGVSEEIKDNRLTVVGPIIIVR